MNNEVLFLKYLDGQLTTKEAVMVEKILNENPDQRQIFESVRKKRHEALDLLASLNPQESFAMPTVESIISKSKTKKIRVHPMWQVVLRYAAAILIIVALPLSFWLFDNKKPQQNTKLPFSESTIKQTSCNNELDYYISPNRCWHQKELICTVIELNN
jgi:anti-sigma factor RsiW